ncbi:putative E3 ubiquitin-protein ligase XBAT31 [Malania oleifera]|uniref:putative E3 ubiquitin-protein ligase XBAT31 n=1 Tax=Malania oleifera TaxID=397392 RepID=UPI0025AE87BD|nr:putative E3 ubiquitin-protein ligase XBAT31 [Malania oleifera]
MGQGLSCSCREGHESALFCAVRDGDLEVIRAMVESDPSVLELNSSYERASALHVAAASGRIEVLSLLLDRSVNPDVLNRHKQTPLMLAAMHGRISCVQKLIQAGANILMFDSLHGRTCLHYAAYYGHSDCLKAILSAAISAPVAHSWGFARFVNIRNGSGETPLHLAARQGHPECVHVLLDNGALACASTGGYGRPGSTPLHLAARRGSLDCVRELLAWGADRLQEDQAGRIPYMVALKLKHGACAALLNPSSAEPLVWPSPLKFISELNPEAKTLLERALLEANKEREKAILKGTDYSIPSPMHSDVGTDDNASEASDMELCCICFDHACTIEVRECRHQMCANCILSICCHNKPNSITACSMAPVCPFCRSSITQLVVAKIKTNDDAKLEMSNLKQKRSRQPRNLSEGSSSFKSLPTVGSLGKMGGRNSGKIVAECNEGVEKP